MHYLQNLRVIFDAKIANQDVKMFIFSEEAS